MKFIIYILFAIYIFARGALQINTKACVQKRRLHSRVNYFGCVSYHGNS